MSDGDDARGPRPVRPTLKQRLTALFEDYGRIAVITYFTLSILAIIGFSIAIWLGVEPSSETGVIGVIIGGWVAAKVTLPLRILITLAVTPLIALVVRRRRPDEPAADEPVADAPAVDEPPPPDA
jgi:phosphate/sulfate permease